MIPWVCMIALRLRATRAHTSFTVSGNVREGADGADDIAQGSGVAQGAHTRIGYEHPDRL